MLQRVRSLFSRRSEFTQNVAKIFSGQAVTTVISFLALPIVTRIYAAEDFGDLQLLASIVSTFVVFGSLKYEMAIVLPRQREEANQVAVLCLVVLALTTSAFSVLLFLLSAPLLGLFKASRLEPFAFLIVAGFVLGGLVRIAWSQLVANKRFGDFSKNNVVQVSTSQGLAIGSGLVQPSFLGLFASQMAGSLVAILLALRRAPIRLRGVQPGQLREAARRYRKFPMVNTVGVFFNTLGLELPVFLLARFFDPGNVGFYMLTTRLLNQPVLLVGQAFSQVYFQAASQARGQGRELLELYRRTVKRLALLGLLPALVVFLAAPPLVRIVLGAGYETVGVYMQILMLWKYCEFFTNPIQTTFSVLNRQEIGVAINAASLVVRFGAMVRFRESPESMLLALSVSGAAFTLLYNLFIYRLLARGGS